MQCASASKPVVAVSSGESPSVSRGSSTATFGKSVGEETTMRRRTWSRSIVTVAMRLTSEPVPEVVGTAIRGGSGPVMRAAPSPARSASATSCVARTRRSFATSIAAPPPTATTRSACAPRKASLARSTWVEVGFVVTLSNTE